MVKVLAVGQQIEEVAAAHLGQVAERQALAGLDGHLLVALPGAGVAAASGPWPSMVPGPSMATLVRFSPQIRALRKWLWPKSW